MSLGVFGGTFNPIHYGHLRAAEEVRQRLGLGRVVFVPTGTPPLKSEELARPADRYRMVELAISTNAFFEASDIECGRPGTSYSVDTIEKIREARPGERVFFITGVDSFLDLHLWRDPERLVSLAEFVIVSRPGYSFSDLASSPFLEADPGRLRLMDEGMLDMSSFGLKGGGSASAVSVTPFGVSASAVRGLLRRRMSVKYLLPEDVESFIMSHGLYAGG